MNLYEILLICVTGSVFWMLIGIFILMMLEDFRLRTNLHWFWEMLICTISTGPIGFIVFLYIVWEHYIEKKRINDYWDNWVLQNCNVKNEKVEK